MLLVVAIILLFAPRTVLASDSSIVINEFSSANGTDWVELYNGSAQPINLSDYSLQDGSGSGNKKTVSCSLSSYGFVVIEWGNSLNKDGDRIVLKQGDVEIDCIAYGDGSGAHCSNSQVLPLAQLNSGEYARRTTDGNGTWEVTSSSTKDGPNDSSLKNDTATCVFPTPTPEHTPTPTKAPSPTKKPTPTNTPRPSPTPAIREQEVSDESDRMKDQEPSQPAKTPAQETMRTREQGKVAGISSEFTIASESGDTKTDRPAAVKWVLFIVGMTGVAGAGMSAYHIYRGKSLSDWIGKYQ